MSQAYALFMNKSGQWTIDNQRRRLPASGASVMPHIFSLNIEADILKFY